MGIFSRTRDIVAANMTDLLDRAEDPAKMIRMIILEMEETLVEVRASAARHIADQLKDEITQIDDALHACEADIAKLQNKLREARARQTSIVTRMESAENRLKLRQAYTGPRIDDAFSRFELMERRVDLAEGRADAAGMGGAPKTLEEEIAELRSSDKVDAELAAMKARAAGQNPEG
ncbi:MAG: PspA/IM30 family protein [Methyloceanibacter sp.]